MCAGCGNQPTLKKTAESPASSNAGTELLTREPTHLSEKGPPVGQYWMIGALCRQVSSVSMQSIASAQSAKWIFEKPL